MRPYFIKAGFTVFSIFISCLIIASLFFLGHASPEKKTPEKRVGQAESPDEEKLLSAERDRLTPVHKAAVLNDAEEIVRLFGEGAAVDAEDANGLTPLWHAAKWDSIEAAKILLDRGANPDPLREILNPSINRLIEGSPMTQAIRNKNVEMVKLLISKGAPVNETDPARWGPLFQAIKERDLEICRILIENGAKAYAPVFFECNNETPECRECVGEIFSTPLHETANCADAEIARLLVENGANVNALDYSGRTPLLIAIKEAEFPSCTDLSKEFPGREPDEQDFREYIYYLLDSGAETNIFVETFLGRTREVKKFLDRGPERMKEVERRRGYTPLHYAIQKGKFDIAGMLIDFGVDVNAKAVGTMVENIIFSSWCMNPSSYIASETSQEWDASEGTTPLHVAAGSPYDKGLEIGERLIEAGADVNARDTCNFTPLHVSIFSCSPQFARLLLSKGAKIDAADHNGDRPIHMASAINRTQYRQWRGISLDLNCRTNAQLVKVLIEAGADANALDGMGLTPLHKAICKDVAKELIAAGADVNARSTYSRTPLSMARQSMNDEVARFLLEHNAIEEARPSGTNGKTYPDDDKYPQLPEDAEDYEVYSGYIQNSKSGRVVIRGHTGLVGEHTRLTDLEKAIEEMPSLTPELYADFEKKNEQAFALGPHFKISGPYYIIGKNEIDHLFSRDGGWERFHQNFPGYSGIIGMSRVGFNKNKDLALVYIRFTFGDLASRGFYCLLAKENGSWVAKERYLIWIS